MVNLAFFLVYVKKTCYNVCCKSPNLGETSMKKQGYTLAEALVAMTIIGVVAALMLPLFNKFRPDSDKAMFLKTYDAITEVITSLTANETLYPPYETIVEGDCMTTQTCDYEDYSRAIFYNKHKKNISEPNGNIQIGNDNSVHVKLCQAIGYYMHADDANTSCNNDNSFTLMNNVKIEFKDYSNVLDGLYTGLKVIIPPQNNEYHLIVSHNGLIAPDYSIFTLFKPAANYILTRTSLKKTDMLDDTTLRKYMDKYRSVSSNSIQSTHISLKKQIMVLKRASDNTLKEQIFPAVETSGQ